MLKRGWFALVLVLLTGSSFLLVAGPAVAAPPGFEDKFVASVESPTSLAFTPDGRMLITTQPGQVRVYKNGALLGTPALALGDNVCSNSERGLLGLAVDPDFETNGYVYAYYTFNKSNACPLKSPADPRNPVNQVSRFTMSDDKIDPGSEKVLITNIPSPNGNHNAGDLHFGKDELLYVSVGDGGCSFLQPTKCQPENDIARYRNVLNGKVLRIDPDGATAQDRIPQDNPYTGADSRACAFNDRAMTASGYVCQEIFATGLRNPFRMAFDPDASGTSFRINDVGGARWEEIDVGKKGADYGWNVCEGAHDNDSRPGSVNCSTYFTPPIHEYNHNTGCSSVTGGAFVPDDAGWPAGYDRSYLFGDYVCGNIFNLVPKDGGGFARLGFSFVGQGGPTAMTFGPYENDKALYYATYAGGSGQIRRIAYSVGNRQPSAVAETTTNNYGAAPLTVSFKGSDSTDPDRDPLTYEWDFDYAGDQPTVTADFTVDSTDADPTHVYTTEGKKTAALRVKDDEGGVSDVATVEVFSGNANAPEPVIESPEIGVHFGVGQEITLRGSATDADQPDNPPALEWEVLRNHNDTHTHPYASGTGDSLTFDMPAPEDLTATNPSKNNLQVRLTATDSQGLARTVTRTIYPKTTMVGFATRPRGLDLQVNGRTFVAPRAFLSWEGYNLNVFARRYQRHGGKVYVFRSWSDGRARTHTITTPVDARAYVARYQRRR